MTKLLVSVRSDVEAIEALAGGADVIDVKEPLRGSLGAASAETRCAVHRAMQAAAGTGTAVPLSAALGELRDDADTTAVISLEGFAYAKIGLAGCATWDSWEQRWQQWIVGLPLATAPVAVVYADYREAQAPRPWKVLQTAMATRTRTLLVDTFDKNSGGTLDKMAACELADIVDGAHAEGFLVALAGSIRRDTIADYLRLQPDWIAVRGAVCRQRRESELDRDLVKQFAKQLSTPCSTNAAFAVREMIDSTANRA